MVLVLAGNRRTDMSGATMRKSNARLLSVRIAVAATLLSSCAGQDSETSRPLVSAASAQRSHSAASNPKATHDRKVSRYLPEVRKAAARYRLSPALILAVIEVESNFNPRAVSRVGARGLMQIMPATGSMFGAQAHQLFDPAVNIDVGSRYLRYLANRYHGNVETMLKAYNWGPGNVERYSRIPKETRNYLKRVRSAYYRHAYLLAG